MAWICLTCTVQNTSPFGLVCDVCQTPRIEAACSVSAAAADAEQRDAAFALQVQREAALQARRSDEAFARRLSAREVPSRVAQIVYENRRSTVVADGERVLHYIAASYERPPRAPSASAMSGQMRIDAVFASDSTAAAAAPPAGGRRAQWCDVEVRLAAARGLCGLARRAAR